MAEAEAAKAPEPVEKDPLDLGSQDDLDRTSEWNISQFLGFQLADQIANASIAQKNLRQNPNNSEALFTSLENMLILATPLIKMKTHTALLDKLDLIRGKAMEEQQRLNRQQKNPVGHVGGYVLTSAGQMKEAPAHAQANTIKFDVYKEGRSMFCEIMRHLNIRNLAFKSYTSGPTDDRTRLRNSLSRRL